MRSQLTAASLIQYAEEVYGPYIRFTGITVPDGSFEPEYEETFTRRQKRQYEQAVEQRTETKRIVTKRKASTLGKAKQARR